LLGGGEVEGGGEWGSGKDRKREEWREETSEKAYL